MYFHPVDYTFKLMLYFHILMIIFHSYRENSTSYLVEYTPLIAAYFILFLYIYFSVQKIEMVSSTVITNILFNFHL